MNPSDFPLAWPEGRARCASENRIEGRFRVDFQSAYDGLVDEAEKIHGDPARRADSTSSTSSTGTGTTSGDSRRSSGARPSRWSTTRSSR